MIHVDTANGFFIFLVVLNFLGILLAIRLQSGLIISFVIGFLSISFGAYLLTDPLVYHLAWSQPIYFSNGTLLDAGGFQTYVENFFWHPYSELLLVLMGSIDILAGGKALT